MLATSGTLYDGCPRPRFQVPIKVAEMTKCEACDALRGPHRSPGLFAAVHPAKNRLENGPKPDGGEGGLDRVGRSQMYPMLRGVVVERQQHIDVLGDLRDCLGPLGAVVGIECLDRGQGMVAVLGVVDLGERGFRTWVR